MKTLHYLLALVLLLAGTGLLGGCTAEGSSAASSAVADSAEIPQGTEITITSEEPPQLPVLMDVSENFVIKKTPKSERFSSIAYDQGRQVLKVVLRKGGEELQYSGFPAEQWEAFSTSGTKGQFYDKRIKNLYPRLKTE